jgi:hypothetical protein
MDTTISIKDDLLVEATAAAAQSGQTVDEFIEDAMRRHLDAATSPDPGQPSENYSPGDDADALLEKMKFGLGVGG